ncbi:MAG: hypothetical protein ICV73_02980 [Acetobacteraceae bacterium]|nr:hypothetical protein [Acetobacteraceae bacterium]
MQPRPKRDLAGRDTYRARGRRNPVRRGIGSGEKFGRCRKAERALARPARFGRPAVRHEPRAEVHFASTALACAIV